MPKTWQRIAILGNAGSGKTTLAIALGKLYNLPVVHLDRELLHHQFQHHLPVEQEQRHARLIAPDRWVVDGNYHSLIDARLKRTELLIFLNVSRLHTLPRVVQRHRHDRLHRDSIPPEAKNILNFGFLYWSARYNRHRRLRDIRQKAAHHPQLQLLVLHRDTTEHWLEQIKTLIPPEGSAVL